MRHRQQARRRTIISAGSAAVSYSDSCVACHTAMASVSPPSGRSRRVAGSSFITSTNTSSAAVTSPRAQQRHVHAREHVEAVGAEAAGRLVELARTRRRLASTAPQARARKRTEVRVEQSDHRPGEEAVRVADEAPSSRSVEPAERHDHRHGDDRARQAVADRSRRGPRRAEPRARSRARRRRAAARPAATSTALIAGEQQAVARRGGELGRERGPSRIDCDRPGRRAGRAARPRRAPTSASGTTHRGGRGRGRAAGRGGTSVAARRRAGGSAARPRSEPLEHEQRERDRDEQRGELHRGVAVERAEPDAVDRVGEACGRRAG